MKEVNGVSAFNVETYQDPLSDVDRTAQGEEQEACEQGSLHQQDVSAVRLNHFLSRRF